MLENERLDPPEDAPVMMDADDKEVIRERVEEALGHEPSEDEIAEWLREHVEGY